MVENVSMGWYAITSAGVTRVVGIAKSIARLSPTARMASLISPVKTATITAWPTV